MDKILTPFGSFELPYIGFGCSGIAGGAKRKVSIKILEEAYRLGIRYFDVAPSYGRGDCEEIVGSVFRSARDVIITTKVGIPRPKKDLARKTWFFIKDVVSGPIKRVLNLRNTLKTRPSMVPKIESFDSHDYSDDNLQASIQTSLNLLKRDYLDCLLLHEPKKNVLKQKASQISKILLGTGYVKTFGIGIGHAEEPYLNFGNVWQSCVDPNSTPEKSFNLFRVYHGLLRYSNKIDQLDFLFSNFREAFPNSLLLVSSKSTPHLAEIIRCA